MRNRFQDAIDAQSGCNPRGLAIDLVEAMKQARQDPEYNGTLYLQNDPAIRLIVFQLAFLCGVTSGVANFAVGDWNADYRTCQIKAQK